MRGKKGGKRGDEHEGGHGRKSRKNKARIFRISELVVIGRKGDWVLSSAIYGMLFCYKTAIDRTKFLYLYVFHLLDPCTLQ